MLKRNTNTKINLPAQLDNYYIRILRACHTLAITVNDRVKHGKIFKIIENAGDRRTLMIQNDCLAFISA